MRLSWLFFPFVFLLLPRLWSQQLPTVNIHQFSIAQPDTLHLLPHLYIFPGSMQIMASDGSLLPAENRIVRGDTLYWQVVPPQIAYPLQVQYRFFQAATFAIPGQQQRNDSLETNRIVFNPYQKPTDWISSSSLDYSGSFTRGINLGNNQDLGLNANFNLQLSGKLNNDVRILAAITDENLPLQPEGNTLQIREFDQVFVQLEKGRSRLTAGDFDWTRPAAHFLNYFKKLEGIRYDYHLTPQDKGSLQTRSSMALSRSKFGRNIIRPSEGNQGPYRLTGNAGEYLIIVLAGTEKVWIDGKQLTRGTEADYIIDYNLSEIRFTSKQLITKDRRIVVEFEYTDQRYTRMLYGLDAAWTSGRLRLGMHLIGQQDSRQSNATGFLPPNAGAILRNAGDDPLAAITSTIKGPQPADPLQVHYLLRDTFDACGNRDTILVYAPIAEGLGYQAHFSDLGPGQGNYIQDRNQLANEPVFVWIAPDPLTCTPRGRFEPIAPLVSPEAHQITAFRGNYTFSPKAGISAEMAISWLDPNRLSPLDDADDTGMAGNMEFYRRFDLTRDTGKLQLQTRLHLERISTGFRALNPFRDPEFNRNWALVSNLNEGTVLPAAEQLSGLELSLLSSTAGAIRYGILHFVRKDQYSGLKQDWDLNISHRTWTVQSEGQMLWSDIPDAHIRFFKPSLAVAKKIPRWKNSTLGLTIHREKNDRKAGERLLESSFFFDRIEAYLETDPTEVFFLRSSFAQRKEYVPLAENFVFDNRASEWQLSGQFRPSNHFSLEQNVVFRRLQFSNPGEDRVNSENLLGRTDLHLLLGKGLLRSQTTWETGAGQEPAREFSYIKVAKGQGTHIWLDSLYNNDGLVQAYEMEIAPFADMADYIKVAGFSRNFVRVHQLLFNQQILVQPGSIPGAPAALKKIVLQSVMLINRRTGAQRWNPFDLALGDSSLIASNASIRHTLFFNRGNPAFDLQLSYQNQLGKHIEQSSAESRQNREWLLRSNLRIGKGINLEATGTRGERVQTSGLFAGKNYHFQFWRISPQLHYLSGTDLKISGAYLFQLDRSPSGENPGGSRQHQLSLESALLRGSKSTLQASTRWTWMQLDAPLNTPVAFALLNGLQPGRNLQWRLQFGRLLNKTIQLNFHYEGRKGARGGIIHTGGAQVAAVF